MGTIFPFFQSPGTSPDCHDFSDTMESSLAIASANSLRTLGCLSSGPIDLHMCRFLRWSRENWKLVWKETAKDSDKQKRVYHSNNTNHP